MTRVIFAAAQNAAKRVSLLIIGGLITLSLAACGSSGSTTSADINQPLAGPAAGATAPIAFAPMVGAPADVSTKLNDVLTAASKEKNIAIAAAGDAEYKVAGFLSAAPEAKGTRLVYFWDVLDKSGKRLKRIQGDDLVSAKKTGDPWSLVDDAALQRVRPAKTSAELHDWLTKKDAPAPAAVAGAKPASPAVTGSSAVMTTGSTPAAKPPVVKVAAPKTDAVVVQPVSGAPGDGQTSLTAAMRKHLASKGVKIAEGATANAYSVKGVVEMGAAENGQQPITIRWLVLDPSGKQLSNAVVQRNKVQQGSLDAAWGQVADIAAGAAAAELAKIVPKPTT